MTPQQTILRRATGGLWSHLPTWLCASVAICAAAALTVVIAPGITPVSVLLAAVLLTPFVSALIAAVDQVVRTDDVSVSFWWKSIRRFASFGYGVVAAPAVAVALLVVAWTVWQRTESTVALAPVVVSGAVSAVLVLASTAVLPLGIARPTLRGSRLWLTACHLVARWPVRFLAAPSLLAFGVWASTEVSASLLLLVPAPVALVLGAAFWSSAVELGAPDFTFDDQETQVPAGSSS